MKLNSIFYFLINAEYVLQNAVKFGIWNQMPNLPLKDRHKSGKTYISNCNIFIENRKRYTIKNTSIIMSRYFMILYSKIAILSAEVFFIF